MLVNYWDNPWYHILFMKAHDSVLFSDWVVAGHTSQVPDEKDGLYSWCRYTKKL